MNAKELYLASGAIDDDLILDAAFQPAKQKTLRNIRRAAAVAACLCLLLGGGYLRFFSVCVLWNEDPAPLTAKFSVPENALMQAIADQGFSDYYRLSLPETLGRLSLVTKDGQIYTDAQGTVLYDRNLIRYERSDRTQSVTLALSRVSASLSAPAQGRHSRIHGVSLILMEDTSVPGQPLLSAQWERHGTTVCLSAEGLNENELVSLLKELL